MSEKVLQEWAEKLERERDEVRERVRVLEAEAETAIAMLLDFEETQEDGHFGTLADRISRIDQRALKWEAEAGRLRQDLRDLRSHILTDRSAIGSYSMPEMRIAGIVARIEASLASSKYSPTSPAPGSTVRDWLPFEDVIIKHLFERVEQWRAAGCPPAQTYFTAGLERQVAVMIERDRLPMPSWLSRRLGSDEVFRTVFYKELVAAVQDSSPKLAELLLPSLGERVGEHGMSDAEKSENRDAENEAIAAAERARRTNEGEGAP